MIANLLILSTGHLPPRYRTGGPGIDPGVAADAISYGWLMHIPLDPRSCVGVSPEVLAVMDHARRLDCDYVKFDRDGLTVIDLPLWDWRKEI